MAVRETSRVFFALWPDASVRDALDALARACVTRTGGRAPEAANLHLTLAFVGDVSTSRMDTLRDIGRTTSTAVAPFALALDRVGAFHKQDVAWIGPSQTGGAIHALADALLSHLSAAGFELERRPFHPHVTLARRARTRVLDAHDRAFADRIVWNVSRVTLAASTRVAGALRYVAVDEWPLADPAA